jgi:Phage integrase central domain
VWAKKPETASRLRQRIEKVLNWAASRTYRQGENPARWKGHLENLSNWANAKTKHKNDAIEIALAHTVKGVRGVYFDDDLLEERQPLMADWGRYCESDPTKKGNVIPANFECRDEEPDNGRAALAASENRAVVAMRG